MLPRLILAGALAAVLFVPGSAPSVGAQVGQPRDPGCPQNTGGLTTAIAGCAGVAQASDGSNASQETPEPTPTSPPTETPCAVCTLTPSPTRPTTPPKPTPPPDTMTLTPAPATPFVVTPTPLPAALPATGGDGSAGRPDAWLAAIAGFAVAGAVLAVTSLSEGWPKDARFPPPARPGPGGAHHRPCWKAQRSEFPVTIAAGNGGAGR